MWNEEVVDTKVFAIFLLLRVIFSIYLSVRNKFDSLTKIVRVIIAHVRWGWRNVSDPNLYNTKCDGAVARKEKWNSRRNCSTDTILPAK